METHIITPEANEQAEAISLFLSLIFTKIGNVPINVANPANEVKINGYILSPINYMQFTRPIFTTYK